MMPIAGLPALNSAASSISVVSLSIILNTRLIAKDARAVATPILIRAPITPIIVCSILWLVSPCSTTDREERPVPITLQYEMTTAAPSKETAMFLFLTSAHILSGCFLESNADSKSNPRLITKEAMLSESTSWREVARRPKPAPARLDSAVAVIICC